MAIAVEISNFDPITAYLCHYGPVCFVVLNLVDNAILMNDFGGIDVGSGVLFGGGVIV